MGGYGSGMRGGSPVAEEALRIDIAWMLRQALAEPGHVRSGTLRWIRGGEPSGSVTYRCDMRHHDEASLELRFSVTRRSSGRTSSYTQRIALSHTQPNFGGKRWWMHCPVSGHRVRKLYMPDSGALFASGKVWRIGYRSQRQTERDNVFERLFRLQRRLGCVEGWEMPIRRPKGMHHRTYARLEREYWRLDAACNVAMAQVLSRLDGLAAL